MSNIIRFKNSLSSGPPLQAQSRILMGRSRFVRPTESFSLAKQPAADNGENPHELRQLTSSSGKAHD